MTMMLMLMLVMTMRMSMCRYNYTAEPDQPAWFVDQWRDFHAGREGCQGCQEHTEL